ncbi:hypothetical protein QTP88_027607 [Uroleucon formosanum]
MDQEWTTKTSKKASQTKKVSTPTSPISPTLQQIKNNPPVLNMPNNTFDYDISLSHSTNDTAYNNMNIDIALSHSTTDHVNVPVTANTTYTADSSNTKYKLRFQRYTVLTKPKCSHCGLNDHSLTTCPSMNATDPVCIFCKLPHPSTDRNCQEWSFQRDVKKIMATENVPFREAVSLKKNNYS